MRKPSDKILQILAENIKAYRREHKLSQEELAAKCGLHRTYIGSIERGERNITVSSLEVLASALNVDASELLKIH